MKLARQPIAVFCIDFRNGRCRRGAIRWTKRHIHCPQCEARPIPHAPPAVSLLKLHYFKQFCGVDTKDVKNPFGRENIIEISHIVCLGTHCHQVERRRDMSSEEIYTTPRRLWLETIDAMKVLIMDQEKEFWAEFQVLCYHHRFPSIVCDLEIP